MCGPIKNVSLIYNYIEMNRRMMMCCMLGLALGVYAQESVFLQQYREKVKAYNQDIAG